MLTAAPSAGAARSSSAPASARKPMPVDALTASLVCLLNRLLGAALDLLVRASSSSGSRPSDTAASSNQSSSSSAYREELASKYGASIEKYLQPDSLAALLSILFDSARYYNFIFADGFLSNILQMDSCLHLL